VVAMAKTCGACLWAAQRRGRRCVFGGEVRGREGAECRRLGVGVALRLHWRLRRTMPHTHGSRTQGSTKTCSPRPISPSLKPSSCPSLTLSSALALALQATLLASWRHNLAVLVAGCRGLADVEAVVRLGDLLAARRCFGWQG
jgi:hypothetical protein